MAKITCHNCNHSWQADSIGRRDDCPQCGWDAHVCRNCKFFDEKSYNDCREPQADRVLDKIKSNYCEYFAAGAPGGAAQGKDDPMAALNKLFK